MLNHLSTIFVRDLNKLLAEIDLYKDEQKIWVVEKGISNSAGNLCLHLIGNLNHFIGAQLGNTGYVRERDLEFSLKNIARETLVHKARETITMVEQTLAAMNEEDLEKEYPIEVLNKQTTTGFFLLHLASHLGYHLGQVNYHRRLLDG